MSSMFLMACAVPEVGWGGTAASPGGSPEGPGQALCEASPRPEPGLHLTVVCVLDQGGKQGYGNG